MKKNKTLIEGYEVRYTTGTVELRTADDGTSMVSGYALKFNAMSRDLGGWKEIIAPSALDECKMDECIALFNHNWDLPLGAISNSSLKLNVDKVGLRYDIELNDTSYANDLKENLRTSLVRESSFGFRIARENATEWHYDEAEDVSIRTVLKINEIFDVSPVTKAAYADTSVALRGFKNYIETLDKNKQEILDALTMRQRELTLL